MLFYQPHLAEGVMWLSEEESKHCIKVLRKQVGDIIHVTDGIGFFYECLITKASSFKCEITIQKSIEEKRETTGFTLPLHQQKMQIEWNGL